MTDEESLRFWAGSVLVNGQILSERPYPDSAHVLDFLRRHGIQAITYELSTAHSASPIDHELINWLHGDYRQSLAEEMVRTHEFERVICHIERNTPSRPVIFKGGALAYQIYDAPHLRIRGDIDALVGSNFQEAIFEFFRELGYERPVAIDGPLVLRQRCFVKRDISNFLHVWDVHHQLSNRPQFANVLTYDQILETSIEVRVQDVSFLAPSLENSLLIACLHLIGHHSANIRLIWLYDIHLLLRILSETQLERFLVRVRSRPEISDTCHAALALTQRYLPAERTDELRKLLAEGKRPGQFAARTYLTRVLDDARAIDKGDRLRFLGQHVFPSADYMMKRFSVKHRWQLPFWYVIRAARAVPKLLTKR